MRIFVRGLILLPIMLSGLLTGCEIHPESTGGHIPAIPAMESQKYAVAESRVAEKNIVLTASAPADAELEACKASLSALSLISSTAYAKRRGEFDALLRNAAVYARVRVNVDQATRETLDPLYQYRTRQLCLRISQDVAEGLMTRAESLAGSRTKGE